MCNLFSFGSAFSTIIRTSFITATFSQPTSSTQWIHLRGLLFSWDMPVDIEQWRTEIWNFNGCLHYAIIKLEINLFNIIRVSQALALIIAIIFQYIFKINKAFHFLNIIFVFVLLFIILKFIVTNIGLCFQFNQNCHKQIPYLHCLNTVIVVNVVV